MRLIYSVACCFVLVVVTPGVQGKWRRDDDPVTTTISNTAPTLSTTTAVMTEKVDVKSIATEEKVTEIVKDSTTTDIKVASRDVKPPPAGNKPTTVVGGVKIDKVKQAEGKTTKPASKLPQNAVKPPAQPAPSSWFGFFGTPEASTAKPKPSSSKGKSSKPTGKSKPSSTTAAATTAAATTVTVAAAAPVTAAAVTTAVVASEASKVETQNSKTNLERQVSELKKDISKGNRDDSLENLTRDLIDVTKRRAKIRLLLIAYLIADSLLYVAKNVPIPFAPWLMLYARGLDVSKNTWIGTPLDNYYAKHQNEYANAVARYLAKHPEYKATKVGSKVKITTDEGEFYLSILKQRPEDQLPAKSLKVANLNPYQLGRTVFQFKR